MLDALLLENVRCFRKPKPARIAPLTILVGENSTGKSTFLACVKLACQLGESVATPDFNEEPFLLGAFGQIVHRVVAKRSGDYFEIGFQFSSSGGNEEIKREEGLFPTDSSESRAVTLRARFENSASQPLLVSWKLKSLNHGLSVELIDGGRSVQLEGPNGSQVFQIHAPTPAGAAPFPIDALATDFFYDFYFRKHSKKEGEASESEPRTVGRFSENDRRTCTALVRALLRVVPRKIYASAPIRTEPRRTYEPVKDAFRPGGGHIPMVLAKHYKASEWESLKTSLQAFGVSSGLFKSIDVKRLGRGESSPFQIMIRIAGPPSNLVDVGYGVSQALPLVVEALQAKAKSTFLLQQPEVHLHPRAQAELGSFLAHLVKSEKKRFIVETHSDYLVDRVRMDVRDKKGVSAKDVSILYFHRQGAEVEIHEIQLDELGNLVNVPRQYREFFLKEEHRFLTG